MSYDLMGRGWTARPIVRAGGPGMKAQSALAAALAVALALAACGKEGPPTPPLRAVPAPVKDLAVRQRGTHVLLSFTYPQTTPGGAALNGVTKVEVYEAVLQPPPPLKAPAKAPGEKKPGGGKAAAATAPEAGKAAKATAAGAATAAEPGAASSTGTGAASSGAAGSGTGGAGTAAVEPGATATAGGATAATTGKAAAAPAPGSAAAPSMPSPLDPRQYETLGKLRLTLTSKDLGAATLGNQLIIDLPLPEPLPAATVTAPAPGTAPAKVPPAGTNAKAAAGAATATAAAGLTRDYAVRAYGPQGDRSALSNQALLMPKEPPQAPEGVTVTPQADGILAAWKPVPNGGGYAVYRRAATERFSSKPLALVRSGETRHLDQTARFGQSYIYSVTTVDPKQPLVESAIKAEQEIRYVDVYPPPVPEELVAVAEAGRARLVWRQSEAPDLAGYIVYRKGATGDYVRLTAKPIAATNYVDTAVVSGQAYDYRVTAIDQTGNESAPSAEVHVAVP
jgi:predicted small lipoprotein YifL